MLFDWSKTHLTDALLAGFEALAEAAGLRRAARGKLFAGEVVNPTEDRAAEHTALRGVGKDGERRGSRRACARGCTLLVEAIHEGALGEVRHLIHIGIGGSALGPALAVDALARDGALVDVHVVSNIDGVRARGGVRGLRSGDDAGRGRLQDLHHHRDHDQCRERARLAARERRRRSLRPGRSR